MADYASTKAAIEVAAAQRICSTRYVLPEQSLWTNPCSGCGNREGCHQSSTRIPCELLNITIGGGASSP
jgi:hypothetical protein